MPTVCHGLRVKKCEVPGLQLWRSSCRAKVAAAASAIGCSLKLTEDCPWPGNLVQWLWRTTIVQLELWRASRSQASML